MASTRRFFTAKLSHTFFLVLTLCALATAVSGNLLIQDEQCNEGSGQVSLLQRAGAKKHPAKLRPQVQTGSFLPNLSHGELPTADHQLYFSPISKLDNPRTSSGLLRPVHDLVNAHFPTIVRKQLNQVLHRVDVTFLRNHSRSASLMRSLWVAPACCGVFILILIMSVLVLRYLFWDRLYGSPDDKQESSKADDDCDPQEVRKNPTDVEVTKSAEALLTENSNMKPQPVGFFGLFRYATRQDKLMFCAANLLCLCSGACSPLTSFLMADIIDAFRLPNDDGSPAGIAGPHVYRQQHSHRIVSILIAMAAFKLVVLMLGYSLLVATSMSLSRRIKAKAFNALLKQDVGWYDSNSPTEMLNRFSRDCMLFHSGVGDQTMALLVAVANTILSLGLACYRSFKLTAISVAVGCVCLPVLSMAMNVMRQSEERKAKHLRLAGSFAHSALSSIRTVKAFNGYAKEQHIYEECLKDAEKEGIFFGSIKGWCNAAFAFQTYTCMAMAIFVGFVFQLRDVEGECWRSDPPFGHCLTGGAIFSVVSLVAGACGTTIPNQIADLTQATTAAGRIYALIDYKPKIGTGGHATMQAPEGRIEYRGVSFAYPTRPEKVLKEVNITVPAGSTVAFVGPSGSGKSTLVSLILRFHDPLPGSIILFDGKDISTMNLLWLRRQIGLVEQEPVLYSGTVASNIRYGMEAEVGMVEVEQAARDANAHNFLADTSMFPDGYKTKCGEGGVQLSGGQKQRVAIARALLRKPKVLLLDEATSALDTQSEKIVQATLDLLISSASDKARTIMLIAQRLSTVTAANKIYVLDAGRIVQSGSHSELMQDSQGTYAKLYQLQSQGIHESAGTIAGRPERGHGEELNDEISGSPKTKNACAEPEAQRIVTETCEDDDPESEEFQAAAVSRIWALCKEDARLYMIGIASLLVISLGPVLSGLMQGSMVTLMTAPPALKNEHGIWVATYQRDQLATSCTFVVLMMLIVGLVVALMSLLAFSSFHAAGEAVVYRVRSMVFKSMLRQDNAWFDQPIHQTGTLCDALATQAEQAKFVTGFGLASYVEMVISILACIVAACIMCWQLCLVLAGLQLLNGIPICIMAGASTWDEHMAAYVVSEAVTNIRITSSYNLGERLVKKYLKLLDVQLGHEWRFKLRQSFSFAVSQVLGILYLAACVLAATEFLNRGWIDPVRATICCFILTRIGSSMQSASQWVVGAQVSKRAFGHIFKAVDNVQTSMMIQTEECSELQTVKGRLELRDVKFYYPQRPDAAVLQNFSIVFEPNTTTALVGPSGNGKSTVIAMLERYYDPVEGAVLFDGVDIKTLKLTWLRQQLGLVQQEPILFEGSIADNIAYGWQGSQKPDFALVEAAARAANAHDFISHFVSGYDTNCGRKGLQLSGGQKQRISIARALFLNPRVLLLDEATSALDSESERVVQAALEALMAEQQRTTVVIAHRLSTIANSDQICVIEDGRVVERHQGKPGEAHEVLKAKGGAYSKLLSARAKTEKEVV